ncbi:MAG: DUF2066 domain-containing protein [Alphaproteobacteria bacterium]
MTRPWRVMARAVVAAAAIAIAAGTAVADPFTVAGIAVDETAADATAARARALASGQRAAWQALVRRLVAPDDAAALLAFDEPTIAGLVQSFQVASEKVAPDRYIAELTYRFDGPAVRRLFEASGVTHVVAESPPVLILPVLDTGAGLLLFELDNGWREAWQAMSSVQGLVPVVVPIGDLADLAAIDAEQAVSASPEALAAIAGRYGTASVAVAVGRLGGIPGSPTGLDVTLTVRRGGGTEVGAAAYAPPPGAGEDVVASLYGAAIEGTLRSLEDSWRDKNLVDVGTEATLAVEVPVSGLAGWLDVDRRLASVGLVRGVRITVMGVKVISAELRYVGDQTRLVAALADAGLGLERDADLWILRAATVGEPATDAAEPGAGTLVIE